MTHCGQHQDQRRRPRLVAACTTMPSGPSVMVLPSTSKSFDQFRADDMVCRNFALESVGGVTASQAATQSVGRQRRGRHRSWRCWSKWGQFSF